MLFWLGLVFFFCGSNDDRPSPGSPGTGPLPPAPGAVTPDARELHRVITASGRELLETARLEVQAGGMDADPLERLAFRTAAPHRPSVVSLTDAQRGELLPNIVRVMLAAFLEEQAR